MADPILRGDNNPIRQKRTWTFNASSGGTYVEEHKGIDLNKMVAQWNGTIYTAQSGELSYENGIAQMRIEWATAGGGGAGPGNNNSIEVTTDKWDCPEPRETKSLMMHPRMLENIHILAGYLGAVNLENCNKIAKFINKALESSADFGVSMIGDIGAANWDTYKTTYPANYQILLMHAQLMIGDQGYFNTSQYAVRHTTNAPNGWGLNRADIGVNCLYSQAQFLSEVTDGSLWYFPMPGRLQYKFAAAYSNLVATRPALSEFFIGWLKGPSGESTAARGRIEIQTTYILDQWSIGVYPTI